MTFRILILSTSFAALALPLMAQDVSKTPEAAVPTEEATPSEFVESTDAAAVATACAANTNLPAPICACVGERAVAELTDDQRAFVIATYGRNFAETGRLRSEMPIMDTATATMLATRGPQDCARSGG